MSELAGRLWTEYAAFFKCDLSERAIVYLYVDGIAERLRSGQRREAVLAALGHWRGRTHTLALLALILIRQGAGSGLRSVS